jgi:hypothetical protein
MSDDLPAVRDSEGRFVAGHSGNPGGRTPRVVLAARAKLADHLDEAITEMLALMKHADPRIRLAAVCEVRDTVMGKPRQVDVDTSALVQAEMSAIFARLRASIDPELYRRLVAEVLEGTK